VVFVRHRRARRFILRVLDDGTVRVTLPRWGARREAEAFLDASRTWIARQRARRASQADRRPAGWTDGTTILIDGCQVPLRIRSTAGGDSVWCGDALVHASARVPSGDLRGLVEPWLIERARRELPQALRGWAAHFDITVPRISIRNQRSRWGACSPTGTITLNWRLIQVPPVVREYVLIHELMHRRELNHSRRFWRLVASACPEHAAARRWLRTEGKSLWPD
jgi:predicted metal-dependent hydrolase